MYFTATLTTSIVALAGLAAAAPRPALVQNAGVAIPITKRSRLVHCDHRVDVEALKSHVAFSKAYVISSFASCQLRQSYMHSKILRGFDNFQKNTGALHPAALKGTQKRSTGADALIADNNELWFGTISVGVPANTFTGKLACIVTECPVKSFSQSTLTRARGIFP